jgi:hypothetical protein
MYLLYSDESGQHAECHFVLAGIAIFERQTYWLASALDQIQLKFFPDIKGTIELHATVIRAGKESPWNTLTDVQRHQFLDAVYDVIAQGQESLFAIVIEPGWCKDNASQYDFAFESLVDRFDRFLRWKYKEENNAQRGLMIIAESEYRERIEILASRIRQAGTRWGEAYNLSEIPLFTQAANSRLLQVADFCANAVYGKFEGGFARQFDRIASKFFQAEGVVHGSAHYTRNHDKCMCIGCLTRRLAGTKAETQLPPLPQQPML